jgi:hypothetical protein
MYSLVSLLIFFFAIGVGINEKETFPIFMAFIFVAIQWGIYCFIKWPVRWLIIYLKEKCPADWIVLFSVWIATIIFLLWALICFSLVDEDNVFTQFIIGSLCIAAALATVLFTIKKMKKVC